MISYSLKRLVYFMLRLRKSIKLSMSNGEMKWYQCNPSWQIPVEQRLVCFVFSLVSHPLFVLCMCLRGTWAWEITCGGIWRKTGSIIGSWSSLGAVVVIVLGEMGLEAKVQVFFVAKIYPNGSGWFLWLYFIYGKIQGWMYHEVPLVNTVSPELS